MVWLIFLAVCLAVTCVAIDLKIRTNRTMGRLRDQVNEWHDLLLHDAGPCERKQAAHRFNAFRAAQGIERKVTWRNPTEVAAVRARWAGRLHDHSTAPATGPSRRQGRL